METYEVLVINTEVPGFSAKRGDVVSHKSSGANWSERERSSRFAVILVSATQESIGELRDYKYDFDKGKFIDKNIGIEFDYSVFLPQDTLPVPKSSTIISLASEIDTNWTNKNLDACAFLHTEYLGEIPADGNYEPFRKIWLNKFLQFKELEGMKNFITYVRYRDYGEIAECANALPKDTIRAMLDSKGIFTSDDINWMNKILFRKYNG